MALLGLAAPSIWRPSRATLAASAAAPGASDPTQVIPVAATGTPKAAAAAPVAAMAAPEDVTAASEDARATSLAAPASDLGLRQEPVQRVTGRREESRQKTEHPIPAFISSY